MKNILYVNEQRRGIDLAILAARVSIGLLMLSHGLPKLAMLLAGEPVQFPGLFGLSGTASLSLAVFAEVICSILLILGFATRLAVIPLGITMLVAVFLVHAADPLAKKEPALLYLLVYVLLFLTGSGRFSLDYLLQKKQPADRTLKPEEHRLSV